MGVLTRSNFEDLTHKGREIYTGSGLPEDNNPMSCVLLALLFHDFQGTPTSPFICKGCEVKGSNRIDYVQ
jgi:hypothetical protein